MKKIDKKLGKKLWKNSGKIVEKIVQKRDAEEISVCYFWSIILDGTKQGEN